MARTKKFDPKQALAAAMNVFWRLGYENTSLDVLMAEMGIARQSLYDTFGDKRSLYLKALAHYRDETNASMRRLFSSAPTVKDGLAQLSVWPQCRVTGAARARLLALKRKYGARRRRCSHHRLFAS